MKRSLSILTVLISLSLLSGCITSKTPKTNDVNLLLGAQVEFSVKVFPSGGSFAWTLDGVPLSNSEKSYTYTAQSGAHDLTVKAKHIFGTDTQTWHIITNSPPVAHIGPDQTVAEKALVTLDASNSTDPDNDIISYAWEQTGGKQVVLSNPNAVTTTFLAPDVDLSGDALTFKLTVADASGLTSIATCIVNITGINDPPTAVAGPDQTVPEGTSVTLDGSGSIDWDDGIAQYEWKQFSGPAVVLTNANTVMATFMTPDVGPGGAALTFELTVTDKGGLKSAAQCIVNVTWVNEPPTAVTGPDQNVAEGVVVTLDASGSTDPDGNIVSYSWQQTEGPAVTLSNAAAVQPRFTSPNVGPTGATLVFKLTVTDDGGLMASDNCMVTVYRSSKRLTGDVLYTAYAGIGYGRVDSPSDDEALYNIMLDDLNTVAGDFVLNTIFNDPNVLNKLLFRVLLGLTTTFNYTDSSGVVSSLFFDPGAMVNGYRSFAADLSVNFNATGYAWETCLYYGDSGGVDLTAHVTGYFKATSAGLTELYLHSVSIQAQNTLKAVYPMGQVTYNQWNIAYPVYYGEVDPTYTSGGSTVPVNAKILPVLISEPVSTLDFREYTLSGGFVFKGNAYSLPQGGIRYRQWQYDYLENGITVSRTLLSLSGKLTVPGLTGVITVSTPEDTVNPVGSKTIIINSVGTWISGLMNLSGVSTASQASFSNGTCTFSGGDQGTWSVAGWQNSLEP
jgi:hypothetical protein